MWCLTSRESLEVFATDSVGRNEATSTLIFILFGKTKVMICGGMTKDGMSKSKVNPFWGCKLRVKANPVLCV